MIPGLKETLDDWLQTTTKIEDTLSLESVFNSMLGTIQTLYAMVIDLDKGRTYSVMKLLETLEAETVEMKKELEEE